MEMSASNLHPAPVCGKERSITPGTESPPPAISGEFMHLWIYPFNHIEQIGITLLIIHQQYLSGLRPTKMQIFQVRLD